VATALIMDQELHMLQDAEAVQVAALVCSAFYCHNVSLSNTHMLTSSLAW